MRSYFPPKPVSRCTTAGQARGRMLGKEEWGRERTRDVWIEVEPEGVKDALV